MKKNVEAKIVWSDVRGDQFAPFCQEQIRLASAKKDEIVKLSPSAQASSALQIYNDILTHMDAAVSQASLLSQVHPKEEIRKNAEGCEQDASRFMTDLSLDRQVYDVLKRYENASLLPEDERMLKKTLRDFRRAGVDKDEAARTRIKQLKEELVLVGQSFEQNIRNDRRVIKLQSVSDLQGLPKDYVDAHAPGPDGQITVSTDYPDIIPFMKYAENAEARRKLRFENLNRAPNNEAVLQEMIQKRYELANLLGYSSYAAYIVEDKMIKRSEDIYPFIEKVSSVAQSGAQKEFEALLAHKQKTDPKATSLEGSETAYLENKYKNEHFAFDSQAVRPYFAYEKVRDGLLALTSDLFGISYERAADAQLWDPSVESYDVYDDKGILGRIYLDMHPREGKFKHAAQFTVRSGLADRQLPEGALVCNFPNPKEGDGKAFMEHREVETFFHEFGHLLHHIFAGRQRWMPFSGVATEWDFVEAPSQLFEEWAWDPTVLQRFALHDQTNEPIPTDLIHKMRAADEFGKAMAARTQMFYASLSVNYFDRDPKTFKPLPLLKELQDKYSMISYEEGTNFHHSFGHLEGYSAMYYTYMWSLVIAKDLFGPFKSSEMMNPTLARRYRDTVLGQGGSKDASVLVADFLGRPYGFEAFQDWLSGDVAQSNERSASF